MAYVGTVAPPTRSGTAFRARLDHGSCAYVWEDVAFVGNGHRASVDVPQVAVEMMRFEERVRSRCSAARGRDRFRERFPIPSERRRLFADVERRQSPCSAGMPTIRRQNRRDIADPPVLLLLCLVQSASFRRVSGARVPRPLTAIDVRFTSPPATRSSRQEEPRHDPRDTRVAVDAAARRQDCGIVASVGTSLLCVLRVFRRRRIEDVNVLRGFRRRIWTVATVAVVLATPALYLGLACFRE
jgi:hypothetical protein